MYKCFRFFVVFFQSLINFPCCKANIFTHWKNWLSWFNTFPMTSFKLPYKVWQCLFYLVVIQTFDWETPTVAVSVPLFSFTGKKTPSNLGEINISIYYVTSSTIYMKKHHNTWFTVTVEMVFVLFQIQFSKSYKGQITCAHIIMFCNRPIFIVPQKSKMIEK